MLRLKLIAHGGEKDGAEVLEQKRNISFPIPRPKIDLRDAHAIRRELGAVYRDGRAGRIELSDATRLAYILDLLRRAFEAGELQTHLEFLEQALNHRRPRT